MFIGCIRNTFIAISLMFIPLGFEVVLMKDEETVMFRSCTEHCKTIDTKLQKHKNKKRCFERGNKSMQGSSIHV